MKNKNRCTTDYFWVYSSFNDPQSFYFMDPDVNDQVEDRYTNYLQNPHSDYKINVNVNGRQHVFELQFAKMLQLNTHNGSARYIHRFTKSTYISLHNEYVEFMRNLPSIWAISADGKIILYGAQHQVVLNSFAQDSTRRECNLIGDVYNYRISKTVTSAGVEVLSQINLTTSKVRTVLSLQFDGPKLRAMYGGAFYDITDPVYDSFGEIFPTAQAPVADVPQVDGAQAPVVDVPQVDVPREVVVQEQVDVPHVDVPQEPLVQEQVDVPQVDVPREVVVQEAVVDVPQVDVPREIVVDVPQEPLVQEQVDVPQVDVPREVVVQEAVVDVPQVDVPREVVVDVPQELVVQEQVDVPQELVVQEQVDVPHVDEVQAPVVDSRSDVPQDNVTYHLDVAETVSHQRDDCDRDEISLYVPQSEESVMEIRQIATGTDVAQTDVAQADGYVDLPSQIAATATAGVP
jgi:hypothetical protein